MSESTGFATALFADDDKVWAIRESALRALLATRDDELLDARARVEPYAPPTATRRDGVTRIPIVGPITRWPQRGLMAMLLGGGTSIEDVRHDLRVALADPSVAQIVLHVESPGGETDGVTELASEIYEARSRKPIIAFIDSMAASAAYWLASQATEIIVTPSGSVGSVGVFALHLDRSRAIDANGVTPTFIQAGKFKTEESPLHPLSDEAQAAVQARVDAFYGMFTRDVARGRGVSVETVRTRFGEGRMVLARDAVKLGMADEVATRERAIRRRAANEQPTAGVRGAVDVEVEAMSAYTYIETNMPADGYAAQARQTFAWEVLSQGLNDRSPSLHFFRNEDERDRLFDNSSRRERSSIDLNGMAFPERNAGRGEVWIRADLSAEGLVDVIRHEVRHIAQGPAFHTSESIAEADANAYASGSRMRLIDELYGARRAS
jgi:signal peptide peptidase SppA